MDLRYDPGHRSWGDGEGKTRAHTIEDISFSEGWVTCEDGAFITRGDYLSLEDAWDAHRGIDVSMRTVRRAYVEQADDAEVHDFLQALSDPSYIPLSLRNVGY